MVKIARGGEGSSRVVDMGRSAGYDENNKDKRTGKVGVNMEEKTRGLSGNQLKLIAMAAMFLDHLGAHLYPRYALLRIIGRIAFPIFAFMIAEGCRYTRSPRRYLLQIGALALVCQIVSTVATGSLYQSVLVTFTLSIGLIFCLEDCRRKKDAPSLLAAVLVGSVILFLCEVLPMLLPGTDFCIDYGIFGVLLPVAVYFARDKKERLLAAAVLLMALGVVYGDPQWYGLLTLPLLMAYNGTRGKGKLKYLFYVFYPAHLALIYLMGLIL